MAYREHIEAFFKENWFAVLSLAVAVGLLTYIHWPVQQSDVARFQIGRSEAIVMDASRRSVLHNSQGRICAEPAPDVIGTIAASIESQIKAGSDPKTNLEALNTIVSDEKLHKLFVRSQGIQALRDGMFRLCEAYMNDAIDITSYEGGMIDLVVALNFMVPLELCANLIPTMVENVNTVKARTASATTEAGAGTGEQDTGGALALQIFQSCLNLAAESGAAIAINAGERMRTASLIRADSAQLAFDTMMRSYPGSDDVIEYCSENARFAPLGLRRFCQTVALAIVDTRSSQSPPTAAPSETGSVPEQGPAPGALPGSDPVPVLQ